MHWNVVQSCVKNLMIVPNYTEQLQGEYVHSKAEGCQLPTCTTVYILRPFTDMSVATSEHCMD
jgi:hypothetical protein